MVEKFRERIEKNRKRLHELVNEKGLTHPDVIQLSKVMDQMLNEFDEILNNLEETFESVPKVHLRITPTGLEFEISLQEGLTSTHISNAKDLETAKKVANEYVKTNDTNLKIYYLEQLVTD
jgi:hypothetical protein